MGEKPTEVDEQETERRGLETAIKREGGGGGQPVAEAMPFKGESERLDFKGGNAAPGIAVSDEGASGPKKTTK